MQHPTLAVLVVSLLLWSALGCASGAGRPDPDAAAPPPERDAGADAPATPRACIEGAKSCHDDRPSRCEDGEWVAEGERCPELCHPELGCVADDPCGRAVAAGSYLGCEYWAAPLPNAPSEHLREHFDFRIVVANTDDDAALVTVRRGSAVVASQEIAPGAAEDIALPWIEPLSRGVEHIGGSAGEPAPSWSSLVVAEGAYHVTSDRPVAVYQFNPFQYRAERAGEIERYSYSNDASLLLPVHALGRHHRGVSYVNQSIAIADDRLAEGRNVMSYPGYLAIVGVSDPPVEVAVQPTAPIAAAEDGRFPSTGPGETVRFTVARGEVVVVTTEPNPPCDVSRPGYVERAPSATGLSADRFCHETEYDLTGSLVESSGPVAVFGGHVCAFVPYDAWACDHLETQIPPSTTLGTDLVVAPLVDPIEGAPKHTLVRVIGLFDDTRVDLEPPVGDIATFTLAEGETRELRIEAPHHLSASEGVMVAELMVGQLSEGFEEAKRGDPAILSVPPSEQYRATYAFVTPESYDLVPSFPGSLPGQSYVSVIRPAGLEVRLDGTPLDGYWQTVGDWEVGVFPIAGGSHRMESAEPFGLLVYGFGTHTSYAYPGGLDLEPILLF